MAKSSLLLVYCGGTIGMLQDPVTGTLRPHFAPEDMLRMTPQLTKHYDIATHFVTDMDSTNIQPHHWAEIASVIAREYQKYQGFVVVHGTDTMAYTATALSFALGNLGKPVVITGAQVPSETLGSDGPDNLTHACQVAADLDFAEVAIVFGTKILRGNRSTKISESERNAFLSPVFPEIGAIRLSPQITYPSIQKRHPGRLELSNSFEGNVAVIQLVPGLSPGVIDAVVGGGIDGLILESFGPGNIPRQENSLLPAIQRAKEKGIAVVISTQCIYGTTRMYLYEVGQRAFELGVLPSRDMTPEAAYVKLKWCLAQTRDSKQIAELFQKSIAGEVTA
jgi:L-asparaginase